MQTLLAALEGLLFYSGYRSLLQSLAITIRRSRGADLAVRKTAPEHLAEYPGGIILVDAKTHLIIAAQPGSPENDRYRKPRWLAHVCHRFICPASRKNVLSVHMGLTVDRGRTRPPDPAPANKISVLKTVTEIQVGTENINLENFIDITPIKDAENTLLAYLRESTLRISNPIELVRDNLKEIKEELNGHDTKPAYIVTALAIQEKNMDGIINNLQSLERAVAEKRTEIPDALREYLKR